MKEDKIKIEEKKLKKMPINTKSERKKNRKKKKMPVNKKIIKVLFYRKIIVLT